MKEIVVKTQAEFDALPEAFEESTRIFIKSKAGEWITVREAWENSSVEAWENSVVRVFSKIGSLLLHGFSVAFLPVTINLNIQKKSEHCHIQVVKDLGWFERNAVDEKPKVVLYKRVSKDFKTQEGTKNETLWAVESKVTHPDWKPTSGECGEGKFHACSRPYFCDEFRHATGDRYIA